MIRTIAMSTLVLLITATLGLTPQSAVGQFEVRLQEKSTVIKTEFFDENHYEIHFVNNHKSEIEVAIHYLNSADKWETNGWWALKPGGKAFVARTKNSIFCYYAHTVDRCSIWKGSEKAGESYSLSVRDSQEKFSFCLEKMNPNQFVNYTISFVE